MKTLKNITVLEKIIQRAHYLANQMIYTANHRDNKEKGDPKVGGHSSATSSAIHIMGALHLLIKTGFDHVANKPHASPADHAYNYLLDLLLNDDFSKIDLDAANTAMASLRAFPKDGEFVFQSYHSTYDPDHHNFFPSGTVGIPPVNAGYLAHAYTYAKKHGYEVPDAHFWAVMGDSEFREGSLAEAIPDFAEREIGNLTWILDYNRQSLDGHRISNPKIMNGTDDMRIQRMMEANGWQVIEVRHGHKRLELFKRTGGSGFQKWYEQKLTDYELQALLLVKDATELRQHLNNLNKSNNQFLENLTDNELFEMLHDFGGHDIQALTTAMLESKKDPRRPSFIIVHTIKGWKLNMAAASGNHSTLPDDKEMSQLRQQTGQAEDVPFARFDNSSPEGVFLAKRSHELMEQIKEQHDIKQRNQDEFLQKAQAFGEIPPTLDINLKIASYPHTQWMLGQLTAKLTRIANTSMDASQLAEKQKPLTEFEKSWKLPSEFIVSMAPDVGTSTNLNPSMDGKIFNAATTEDFETEFNVKDLKTPDLVPGELVDDRYIRFEITEANVMSCMGSYGRLRDILGIPILPLMTIYDFFVKRALDQFFYNLYWKSSFILIGTPAGVTLSPEGAQHGWKSDIQIPNQITWEPFYCIELDWIVCDAMKRHFMNDNADRSGVYIRGSTRGAEQKDLLRLLKSQARYKTGLEKNQYLFAKDFPMPGALDESQLSTLSDQEILSTMREQVLKGAYYLIDYRGYAGYEPGDNVIHIFALGSIGTEAIKASRELLSKGIYANVIMVTNTDLLLGNLGQQNNYQHLKETLGINANIYLQPSANGRFPTAELITLAGRRVPIVSSHDGEPGLLDNIGSIIGVKHEVLAVRKHSRCGRPIDVYQYHHIDETAIFAACLKVLSETALESVQVSRRILDEVSDAPHPPNNWRQLVQS